MALSIPNSRIAGVCIHGCVLPMTVLPSGVRPEDVSHGLRFGQYSLRFRCFFSPESLCQRRISRRITDLSYVACRFHTGFPCNRYGHQLHVFRSHFRFGHPRRLLPSEASWCPHDRRRLIPQVLLQLSRGVGDHRLHHPAEHSFVNYSMLSGRRLPTCLHPVSFRVF
jgi:hypothetical protein